jgi:hypothetical protein
MLEKERIKRVSERVRVCAENEIVSRVVRQPPRFWVVFAPHVTSFVLCLVLVECVDRPIDPLPLGTDENGPTKYWSVAVMIGENGPASI